MTSVKHTLADLRERFGPAVAAAVEEARLTDQETIAKLELRLRLLIEAEEGEQ